MKPDDLRDRLMNPQDWHDVIAVFHDGTEMRLKYGSLPDGWEWENATAIGDKIPTFVQGRKKPTPWPEPVEPHPYPEIMRDAEERRRQWQADDLFRHMTSPERLEAMVTAFEKLPKDTLCPHGFNAHRGEPCDRQWTKEDVEALRKGEREFDYTWAKMSDEEKSAWCRKFLEDGEAAFRELDEVERRADESAEAMRMEIKEHPPAESYIRPWREGDPDFGESEAEKNSPHDSLCNARHGFDCTCGAEE